MYVIPIKKKQIQSFKSRLLADIKELKSNPFPNGDAEPSDEDMLKWHGWVRGMVWTDGRPKEEITFCIGMEFPPTYPSLPPTVHLKTPLKHLNIQEEKDGVYPICLDIFNSPVNARPWTGWSSAFTIRAILKQLHACIFEAHAVTLFTPLDIACARSYLENKKGRIGNREKEPDYLMTYPELNQNQDLFYSNTCSDSKLNRVLTSSLIRIAMYLESGDDVLSIRALNRNAMVCFRSSSVWGMLLRRRWGIRVRRNDVGLESQFLLKANHVEVKELVCFHTRKSFTDGILGWPLDLTVNRHKGCVDLCYTPQDLLSKTGYVDLGVRKSIWNEKFDEWMPLYLTKNHYARSRSLIEKHILAIWNFGRKKKGNKFTASTRQTNEDPDAESRKKATDDWLKRRMSKSTENTDRDATKATATNGTKAMKSKLTQRLIQAKQAPTRWHGARWHGSTFCTKETRSWLMRRMGSGINETFEPPMVLDILPKLLMTNILLLSTEGSKAASKALTGFTQIHRLMLALMTTYPRLRTDVDNRFKKFCTSERLRHRSKCPNIGELIALFPVQSAVSWSTFLTSYLGESFDRGVLWRCRDFPDMAKPENCILGQGPDKSLLDNSWTVRESSCRKLLIWDALFKAIGILHLPKGILMQRYDTLLGFPPPCHQSQFAKAVTDILAVDSWTTFFRLLPMQNRTDAEVTDLLKLSVQNSLRRGYHSADTDWKKIPKKCSRILRRGDKFSVPPDLKKVSLEETWRWTTDNICYLDSGLLAYGFDNELKYILDWCQIKAKGASHSSDLIDWSTKSGTQKMSVDLSELDSCIQSLFVVYSGYNEVPLRKLCQPDMFFVDAETGLDLCRCDLGVFRESATAVVMCRLWRREPEGPWELQNLTEVLDRGSPCNYDPIKACCKKVQISSDRQLAMMAHVAN